MVISVWHLSATKAESAARVVPRPSSVPPARKAGASGDAARANGLTALALSLLTSAATAHAECAWVLWEGIWTERETAHDQSWSVIAGWPSFGDCQPVLSRAVADRAQRWRSARLPSGATDTSREVRAEGNQVSVMSKSGMLNYTYVCLPDTVDPRGPKGK